MTMDEQRGCKFITTTCVAGVNFGFTGCLAYNEDSRNGNDTSTEDHQELPVNGITVIQTDRGSQ